MERYTGFDSRKNSPPPAKHTYGEVSTHTSGAMERYMRGFDFAPALTAFCHNTPQTVSIPVGQWRKCLDKGRRRAHSFRGVRIHVGIGQRCRAKDGDSPTLQAKKRNALRSIGALEGMSGKVQNASTHALRRRIHEHAHSSRSVQRSVQGGNGTLRAGSICMETHVLPQTHVCSGQ